VLRGQDPGVGHHKVDAQWILTHISRTQLDFSTATGGDYFYPNESYNVYGQPEATMEVDCPRSSSETPFPFLAPTFSLAHFRQFLMYIRALLWKHAKIDARVLLFPLSICRHQYAEPLNSRWTHTVSLSFIPVCPLFPFLARRPSILPATLCPVTLCPVILSLYPCCGHDLGYGAAHATAASCSACMLS